MFWSHPTNLLKCFRIASCKFSEHLWIMHSVQYNLYKSLAKWFYYLMDISIFDCRIFSQLLVLGRWSCRARIFKKTQKFILEIEKSSADTWIQSKTFKDFDSEQDGSLCLTRGSDRLGLTRICHACNCITQFQKVPAVRCLNCKVTELCLKCYQDEKEPKGHKRSHRMVRLR